ncbi:MAG: hypothetical protein PUK34_05195 [Clostridia bacterium]|nr:hypothetical protein [Clostridia bacterium]
MNRKLIDWLMDHQWVYPGSKTILQDGIRKGKAEGKAESILELLEDLGEVTDELRLHIQKEKNLDVLTVYLKKGI